MKITMVMVVLVPKIMAMVVVVMLVAVIMEVVSKIMASSAKVRRKECSQG